MSRTITAMFNDRSEAEAAAAQLRADIGADARIIDQSGSGSPGAPSQESGGFWAELKDMFVAEEDRPTYEEGVRRGHFLLSASVPEEQADRACMLIDQAGAMDIDENEKNWGSEGWSGSKRRGSGDERQQGFTTDSSGQRDVIAEERIPLVEEQLRVGKREVERGGARVRSYVEEHPVSQQVNLREENVSVERRPVNEPISSAAADQKGFFQDREIEVRAKAEEPVVAKEARVREEVVVQKTANERTEEVGDTVRNTRVDVEEEPRREESAMGFERDREATSETGQEFDPSSQSRH